MAAMKQGEDVHTRRAAKAKRIDKEGVRLRGCGDGGDSEVGGVAGTVSPTCVPQAT